LRRDLSVKFERHEQSSSKVDESFTGISIYNYALSRKKDLFLVLQPAVGEECGGGEYEEGGEDDKPEESLQHHATHQACQTEERQRSQLIFQFQGRSQLNCCATLTVYNIRWFVRD
jgi:hypothetical protein